MSSASAICKCPTICFEVDSQTDIRKCSGDDPCRRCLEDAQGAAGSRVLMWMECVRPSLRDMSTFDTGMEPLSDLEQD